MNRVALGIRGASGQGFLSGFRFRLGIRGALREPGPSGLRIAKRSEEPEKQVSSPRH